MIEEMDLFKGYGCDVRAVFKRVYQCRREEAGGDLNVGIQKLLLGAD
jgi:hypothetical protein